ncbi:hypothetical protein GH714_040060 [Hevea brasiliensis]|uniref:Late embryogenesis abundant protein LEA-2 subgroup domain-containing protein n=1 Tax=Hevea brasiliensis TaxID=3981 RepID=A0A6A6MP07_HEVBR|nr:hypothetical protein GH714_040060 [Hevea brasiliensis]
MAEKKEPSYPMVANEESGSGTEKTKELSKKKRMKCIAFIVAFTIFQTGVILAFVLVVMRFKSPKFRGTFVGMVTVDKARARARSTRKFDAIVLLKTDRVADSFEQLGRDISSGKLPLTSSSKLEGKIHLMKLIKKKKSAQMNCTMNVDIQTRTLQDIVCK